MFEWFRRFFPPMRLQPVWRFPYEFAPRDQRVLAALLASILAISSFDWIRDRMMGFEGRRQNWNEQVRSPVMTMIEINSAPRGELELLPRIGPKLAERVIEYRRQHGPFRSVDDLGLVPGIGPKTLEQLRPFVVVREITQDSP